MEPSVTAARDPGPGNGHLYSQLATRLGSLAIILPIHLYLLLLESMFATVYHNYHTYAYMAERWRTCPYTIIAFSVNGYVLLTGFHEFTPIPTRHIIQSTIEITALKMTYRSMIIESTDIDRFIIQLSTLMAAEKSSETICHTRRVTGDDDSYHDYRTPLFDPANERNRIRSRY